MDHNCKVVGFLGIDKYEYVLYLSRVLYHLGKKVIMVDYSETGALAASIPCPEGLKNSVIEYRGVMFSDGMDTNETKDNGNDKAEFQKNDFDCVLIDFGLRVGNEKLKFCDRIICVTDQQIHNIKRLAVVGDLQGVKKSLVIKDVVGSRVNPSYIICEFEQRNLKAEQIYIVNQDEIDTRCRINSQYDGVFHFRKLSMQTKTVIWGLIYEMYPNAEKKALNDAFKKAEKGA